MPQDFDNHNGGDLHFGPDGFLYASFGDGGSGGDPNERAQDTTNLMGTIIRIDVDGNSPYQIPNDNPFFGGGLCFDGFNVGVACPEIYAYGLRNPWRFSFDRTTGELWTGDVGQGMWEEVNRVTSGGNYGWDDREGAHCFEPMMNCVMNSLDPVTEYDHSLGVSITGGYVYGGAALPELQGWYVFADFGSGRLFAVDSASIPTVAPAVIEQTGLSPSTFAEDNDGELYLISYGGGTIHQIVDAP